MLGLLIAFCIAESVWGVWDAGAALYFLAPPVWVVVAVAAGLYDRDGDRVDHTSAEDFPRLVSTLTFGAWLAFLFTWAIGRDHNDRTKIIVCWALSIVCMSVLRAAARAICRRQPAYVQNTLIVGADDAGRLIAQKLSAHPEYGLRLVGFVDAEDRNDGLPEAGEALPLLGDLAELEEIVRRFRIRRIILAFPEHAPEPLVGAIRGLATHGVQIDMLPRFFDILDPGMDVHDLEGIPVLGLRPPRLGRASLLLKRTIDLVGSAFLLLVSFPFLALVGLAIKLDSKGPVFFRQVRIGSGGEPFVIWKFRTMEVDADERKADFAHLNKHSLRDPRMFKIERDPRVTRVGRRLRRRRLDELPQLYNVLRGEMSLVGPRPLIPEEHRWVDGWATKRLDLRPGLTGLWQVLGNDAIGFEDMVKLDYRYVTSWSLGRDIALILRTVPFLFGPGVRDS